MRSKPRRLGSMLAMILVVYLSVSAVVFAAKTIRGTNGADKIRGTTGPDRINGLGGNDRIWGRAGADVIKGGRGNDVLRGAKGNDRLIGGPGKDRLIGGPGRNQFNMRDGIQLAAPGNDFIDARNGRPDEINCGAGRDVAKVDLVEDGVYDCEVVREPKGAR